jgi:hypothetical protein
MKGDTQKEVMLGLAIAGVGAYLIYYAYGMCPGGLEEQITCMVANAKMTIMSIAGIAMLWHGIDRFLKNIHF